MRERDSKGMRRKTNVTVTNKEENTEKEYNGFKVKRRKVQV